MMIEIKTTEGITVRIDKSSDQSWPKGWIGKVPEVWPDKDVEKWLKSKAIVDVDAVVAANKLKAAKQLVADLTNVVKADEQAGTAAETAKGEAAKTLSDLPKDASKEKIETAQAALDRATRNLEVVEAKWTLSSNSLEEAEADLDLLSEKKSKK